MILATILVGLTLCAVLSSRPRVDAAPTRKTFYRATKADYDSNWDGDWDE